MSSDEEDFDPVPPTLVIESEELSRGSYGVVYRGRLGEESVAVKRIHSVLLHEEGSERLLNVFKNECRYLKLLHHPNVVKFMGAYRDNEGPLLVMELMKENLEKFLKRHRGSLSFRRQLDICNSIAKGLFFLHNCEEPIIHRDLSDRNILLTEDGTVKIADFGQSKLIDKPRKILMDTRQPGAVSYMPPEVLKESPHYTNTVDTFSLGVLMLEISTQQPPQVGLIDIGRKPEVVRREADLNLLSDDHLLKPLIIWCLQKSQLRPSASVIYNQTTALSDVYEKFDERQEKFELEREAWFALAKQLKQEKGQLEKQLQQIKNADVEKSDLHEMYKRLEEERREAVTEANRLQQELTGIRESQDEEKEHLLMSHEEELKLLRDQLLQKDKAIEVEIAKRSNLEKEIKQLQEKEQLDLSSKPISQVPVPRARTKTNPVVSQVSQGHKPAFQERTDYISSTMPRRSKPSPVGPKPDYTDVLEKKSKRHTIAEMTPPVGVNISGYSSTVAPVEQMMGRMKATSPPPVKPKPKKGT